VLAKAGWVLARSDSAFSRANAGSINSGSVTALIS
jgi:hypothetical protein